jgi:CRP/FNR family transcriptional regulator, cyclic AMP receptor protein
MWSLEQSELPRLLSRCPRRRLRVGSVHRVGDFPAASLLVVETGVVVIAAGGRSRRRIVLSFCSAGALLPPLRNDEQLVALADSAVIAVTADVERTLLQVPATAQVIVNALLDELRERQQSLAQFGNVAHAERLRAKLLQLAGSHGAAVDGGVEVELPLTHKLLAQAIGSARETVTAALKTLELEGFLTRAGSRYRLAIGADALASGTGPSRLPVHDR